MKKVNKIVIVGGGTAGWITASWFSRRWGELLDVTIIDKYVPERVGVGEATLLSFPGVMQKMGFRVEDWMNRIDATFKAGILFPGWGKEDNTVWHPFGFTSVGDKKVPLYDIWTNFGVFLLTYNHTLDNLILVYVLGLPFMLYHLISSLVTFTLIGFPFYALFSQGMNNKLNVEDEITSYEQN